MFSVTITSNWAAWVISRIAAESTNWCSSFTSGNSLPTSMAIRRHSRDDSSTFALSIDVTCLRRPRAQLERQANNPADLRDVGVDESVNGASRPRRVFVRPFGCPK